MMNWLSNLVRGYCQRRIHRHQLLEMDERARRDLAISRVDAEQFAGCYKILKNNKLGRGVNDNERD